MKITKLIIISGFLYTTSLISMCDLDERFQKLAWEVHFGGRYGITTPEEAAFFIQKVKAHGMDPSRVGIKWDPKYVQVYEGSKKVTRDNKTGQYTVN